MLYEEYGIQLHFPKKYMDKEISITVSLKTLDDEYSLPESSDLVSAVYGLCVSGELPSPVTVEIQHCVPIRDSNIASGLSFVRSETKHGPPYKFKVIEGGQFKPDTFYGKIDLTHFSIIAIVRFFRCILGVSDSSIYCTSVYKRQSSRTRAPTTYEVHVMVTKDLAAHLTVNIYLCIWNIHKCIIYSIIIT